MDTAKTERLHVIGAAVLALVIALVGWFLLISPQRSETADIQSQTADAQLQNTTLQSRITQLTGEQRKSGTYAAALAAARKALPGDTDMSSFLRELQAIGAATSTTLTAVSVGSAAPVTAPAAVAPTASGASGASGASASAAPAPAAATAAASGLFEIPITANVTGTPAALNNFLEQLQTKQPRAVLVSQVTLGKSAGAAATLQVDITAFVAPDTTAGASAAPSPASGGN